MTLGEFYRRAVIGDPLPLMSFHIYYEEVKKLYKEMKETFPKWEQYVGAEADFEADVLRWYEKYFGGEETVYVS